MHIAREKMIIAARMRQKPTYDAGLMDKERINRHGCVEMWKNEKSERRSALFATRG